MSAVTSAVQSAFDSKFFIDLLVTELQNQDPEDPVSNAEMVNQIASMTMVSSMDELNASFSQMLELQQLTGGAALIGREVEYSANGLIQNGLVEAMKTSNNEIVLVVDGADVTLDQLTKVL